MACGSERSIDSAPVSAREGSQPTSFMMAVTSSGTNADSSEDCKSSMRESRRAPRPCQGRGGATFVSRDPHETCGIEEIDVRGT